MVNNYKILSKNEGFPFKGIITISANLRKKYRKNTENSRQNKDCKFLDNSSNRT